MLRLGLDIGTNSIGWALLKLDKEKTPVSLVDIGTRIFRDGRKPQEKTSLAVGRRLARGARRTRDRKLKRNKRLMDQLVSAELMPLDICQRKALQQQNPYEIRSRAITGKLAAYELGRAIYHLAQRRGFKSNRKIDTGGEDGVVKSSIKRLKDELKASDLSTLGQLLYERQRQRQGVKARRFGQKSTDLYELYFDRQLIVDEFDAMWSAQEKILALSKKDYDLIKDTITYQRDLHPQQPGKCQFEKNEYRLSKSHPAFQRFRILQSVNNLKAGRLDENLTVLSGTERSLLIQELSKSEKRTFDQLRRKLKRPDVHFNLETDVKSFLEGDQTTAKIISKKGLNKSKNKWLDLPYENKCDLVNHLINEPDDDKIIKNLIEKYNFDKLDCEKILTLDLPIGYGDLSLKVIEKVLPYMEDGDLYYEAMIKAGYDHTQLYAEKEKQLPYYGKVLTSSVVGAGKSLDNDEGEFGKIGNPTVHIALNQIRKLVNALIKRYGYIDQFVVETTRDIRFGDKGRRENIKKNKKNRLENIRINDELSKLNVSLTRENRQKYQLWEELGSSCTDRRCVFTGEMISIARLFSDEVEVEHLLPFSSSLNNSMSNKTLSMRQANRDKGQRTPEEAFSHSPSGYNWEEILHRANLLPIFKRRLFQPNALESYLQGTDFDARHLNDTAYITRSVAAYLKVISEDVWTIKGQMTSLLRRCWDMNQLLSVGPKKNRDDHRHHSIDALICALTDRSMLQKISRSARLAEEAGAVRLVQSLGLPWKNFSQEIKEKISSQIVSFKPDHGVQGGLFDQTALGIVEWETDKKASVVTRVSIFDITTEKKAKQIRDSRIRERVMSIVDEFSGVALKKALQEYSDDTGIRRVRILKTETIIPISAEVDKEPISYKGYKGNSNYCYEIFPDTGKWTGNLITTFVANQSEFKAFKKDTLNYYKHTFCGKPLIMRIQIDDMLIIEQSGKRTICRVVKMSENQITLSPHNESGDLKARDTDKDDYFKYLTKTPNGLRSINARRVFVDILGRIKDPGVFNNDREDS